MARGIHTLKNGKSGKHYHASLGIPKENIIDLRRSKEPVLPKPCQKRSMFAWCKKIRLPKIRFSKKTVPMKIPAISKKTVTEKVIVSRVKKQQSKTETVEVHRPTEKTTRFDYFHLEMPERWYKPLLVFLTACIILVIPFYAVTFFKKVTEAKGTVLGISAEAHEYLREAGTFVSSSEFVLASENFEKATESFIAAQQKLQELGGAVLEITDLVPNKAKSARQLLTTGTQLSEAGAVLTNLVAQLEEININPLDSNDSTLIEFLATVRNELEPVQSNVQAATDAVLEVRLKDIPKEYRSGIQIIQETLPAIQSGFRDMYQTADILLAVLGYESPQRYLLIFQNSRELRPTGGFIGSIALVDIYKGKISNLEVPGGGVYDVAGQLKEKLIAPKPLWLVNPHWNIQDANWFFDFPSSARKLNWFFERTGGASVDGIIALTPAVIEDLFDIVGPIDMQEDYGVTVDGNNFVRQAQYWAEVSYDLEENMPKKFIGDLMPRLLEKVFATDSDSLLQTVGTLHTALVRKDLLLYSFDEAVQEQLSGMKFDGAVLTTDRDYLAVVNTNIGGGKTDHVINELIQHDAKIQSDGSIVNTVSITRSHSGSTADLWEKVANVSYLRLYVPQGSTLLSTEGFDDDPSVRFLLPDLDAISDTDLEAIEKTSLFDEHTGMRITAEAGKTVFGNWVSIDPGEIQTVTIQYMLPFRLNVGGLFNRTDKYSLLLQMQPGAKNVFFQSSVQIPDQYSVAWLPDNVIQEGNQAQYTADVITDLYYGILLKK